MQASLPDLNTQFIKNKGKATSAMDEGKWEQMISAIYGINALLPEEFQVTVSTKQYQDASKSEVLGFCPKCDQGCTNPIQNFDTIPKRQVMVTLIQRVMSGNSMTTIWECPNCNEAIDMADTKTGIKRKLEPYYHRIIPFPPEYKFGFGSRTMFGNAMRQWAGNALNEMDHAMMEYRRNYRGAEEELDIEVPEDDE